MSVLKVIEIIGNSSKGPKEAVESAVLEASKTVKEIKGVDVKGIKAEVEKGKIINWRAVVKISFVVKR